MFRRLRNPGQFAQKINLVHGRCRPPWTHDALPAMGGGGSPETWENVVRMDARDLAGGFRRRRPPNVGGEDEVLLKYGVRSLHRVWNRRERVGEVTGPILILIFIISGNSPTRWGAVI